MDNKTAIQELMEIVEMDANNGVEISMRVFYKMLQDALPKERQQMIDFAKYCSQHTDYVTSYEDCYNQTYTQNNKI